MAANTVPIFPDTPLCGIGSTIATLTSRANITGTTGLTLCLDSQTDGFRLDKIRVQPAADPAAAIVFIWVFDGTTSYLFDEIVINDTTPSNTVAAGGYTVYYDREVFGSTHKIYATTTIAQNTNVFVHAGAF